MIKIENNSFAASALILTFQDNPHLIPCFDLDGVLLEAGHRQSFKPDGSLDLDHYRANTTAELVAKDQDLPLLAVVDWLNAKKRAYFVATARVLCEHTRARLLHSNIKPIAAFGRMGHDDHRKDAVLKTDHFRMAFDPCMLADVVLIDDLISNCEAAKQIGMKAINVLVDHKPLQIE